MALQKQNYNIPLAVGINQKKDPKQLEVGKLHTLENGVFTKIGELRHRYGYTAKNKSVTDGTTISDGRAIIPFKDELNLITSDGLYSYINSNNWLSKGSFYTASITAKQVIRNNYRQLAPTSAYTKGITVYAFEDSSGGVRCTIIDQDSNEAVLSNALVSAAGTRPLCVAGKDYLYIYYADTSATSLKCRRIDPLNPTTLETEIVVTNSMHATPFYDITKFGDNSFVLVYRNTTPRIAVAYIKITGEIAGVLDGFPAAITFNKDPDSSVCVLALNKGSLTNDSIYVFYHNTIDGVNALRYNTNLANTPTPVEIDPETTAIRNITACVTSDTTIQLWYEVYSATAYNAYIKSNTFNRAGTAGTPSVFLRSVGLASKAWRYDDNSYMVVAHQSTLQSTYFTVKSESLTSNIIINKIASNRGAGLTYRSSTLSGVYEIDTHKYILPTNIVGRLTTETGTLAGVEGVQGVTIDFNPSDLYTYERINNSLLIAGGMLQHYDGTNTVEHGFNLYPENVSSSVTNSGGQLVAGVRSAIFIYEWTDAQGQLHRSAPSVAISYTTSGGSSYVTFTIPTLRLTDKKGSKGEISVVGYSTIASGTTYYRMTSVTSPLINDTTADTVSFVWGNDAGETDAAIVSNEILYTTGGVLDNIAPPSAKYLKSYNNRLVIAGLEDENEFWYSKIVTQNEGLAFTDSFTGRIDKGSGGITALAALDDKLIFFKDTQIFATVFQGATDTGANDDYQTPTKITVDVGCNNPKSIVETPLGLFYKSSKGIYLLDRSLNNTYIGADVEDYNSDTVLNATLLEDVNQVRFILDSGVCLVYDYFFQQWGVFTNFTDALSACIWQGKYTYLKTDGTVNVEDSSTHKDNASFVPMRVITSWISTAGLQGYQRIYSGLLLGEFKSPHTLRLRVGYDFNDFWIDDLKIDPKAILGLTPYGEDDYGEGTYGGGLLRDAIYQWQFKQSRQKCQAIRFEISDLDTYGLDGAFYNISQLVLEVGIKKGYNRISQTKTLEG